MAENLAIFDFELDETDFAEIAALDQKASSFFDHRDPAMVKWIGTRKLKGSWLWATHLAYPVAAQRMMRQSRGMLCPSNEFLRLN